MHVDHHVGLVVRLRDVDALRVGEIHYRHPDHLHRLEGHPVCVDVSNALVDIAPFPQHIHVSLRGKTLNGVVQYRNLQYSVILW